MVDKADYPMDIPDPLAQAPATPEEKGFWDTVQEFRTKADEFWTAYKRLEELEPIAMQTPETRASYSNVMSFGQTITNKIEGVVGSIKSAVGWAGSFFGIETVQEQARLGALGIWPIAIIAAAIAAIAIWLSDAYVEINKLESMKELISTGVSPPQARELVLTGGGGGRGGTFGTSFGSELGRGVVLAAFVGLGILFIMRRK